MRRVLRFPRFCLWSLLFVVALGGVLFGYYVYSPARDVPRLSGTLAKGTINVGGLKRTYLTQHHARAVAIGIGRKQGRPDLRQAHRVEHNRPLSARIAEQLSTKGVIVRFHQRPV